MGVNSARIFGDVPYNIPRIYPKSIFMRMGRFVLTTKIAENIACDADLQRVADRLQLTILLNVSFI